MIANKKISKQAKAVLDLYQKLPEKHRNQVRRIIMEQAISFEETPSTELSEMSGPAIMEIWETTENEFWDTYFDEKGYV